MPVQESYETAVFNAQPHMGVASRSGYLFSLGFTPFSNPQPYFSKKGPAYRFCFSLMPQPERSGCYTLVSSLTGSGKGQLVFNLLTPFSLLFSGVQHRSISVARF